MTDKPRLLDLFCGAGGAARGYQTAGFHVTGVDVKPQPRYAGDAFVLGDALDYCRAHGHEFDAIHASPPCQQFSCLRSIHRRDYPDLIEPTRAALEAAGVPFVIENVPNAPLRRDLLLCGTMFGLKVYRHRVFEADVLMLAPPHPKHREPTIRRRYEAEWPGFVSVTGGQNVSVATAGRAMGIDWMTGDELSQAIPPAYTALIGAQLLAAVLATREVA